MAVEHEKFKLSQQVAKMKAEISTMRHGGKKKRLGHSTASSAASSPSPPADIPHEVRIKQELDEYLFALPTPRYSNVTSPSSFSTPGSIPCSRSPTPLGLGLDAVGTSSDLTQHPAAMLCGLQCQSEAVLLAPAPSRTLGEVQWRVQFMIFCHLLYLTWISAIYLHFLSPLRTIMTSLRLDSHHMSMSSLPKSPMTFLLTKWLTSRPVSLNLLTTLSSLNPIPPQPKMTSTHSARLLSMTSQALRRSTPSWTTSSTSLRPILLVSSPSLARPLKDATVRAMRPKNMHKLIGSSSTGTSRRENGKKALGPERGRRVRRRERGNLRICPTRNLVRRGLKAKVCVLRSGGGSNATITIIRRGPKRPEGDRVILKEGEKP